MRSSSFAIITNPRMRSSRFAAVFMVGQPRWQKSPIGRIIARANRLVSEFSTCRFMMRRILTVPRKRWRRYAQFSTKILRVAACIFELVQGESGFRTAPREFFVPLMETLKDRGVAVWVDEIQTFGRTGELFAFQRLDLAEYVDVVTVGKLLQNSALLFREEYQPDPGLISGTFAGSTVGMAVGRRIVEKLVTENFLGPEGKIARIEQHTREGLARLQTDIPGSLRAVSGIGAMWAFEPASASHEGIKALLQECYRNGLILYYAGVGEGPYRVRMFLPGGALTVDELNEGLDVLRFSLQRVMGN